MAPAAPLPDSRGMDAEAEGDNGNPVGPRGMGRRSPTLEDIRWEEVARIDVLGHDAIGPFEIAVNFTHRDGSWVPVYVHTPGYEDLVRSLHRRFPTIPPDWYDEMMANPDWHVERCLWRRDESS